MSGRAVGHGGARRYAGGRRVGPGYGGAYYGGGYGCNDYDYDYGYNGCGYNPGAAIVGGLIGSAMNGFGAY